MSPNDGPDAAAADHQHHRPDVNGAAHAGDAPPGSVAAEAALLVDLLSRRTWSTPSRMPSGSSRGEPAGGASHRHDHSAGASPEGEPVAPDASGRPDGPTGECTCGGTTPAACRVCPVCQLIAFVQQVNPDTIEKVADFVGFAATALRDLATAQRDRRAEPAAGGDAGEADAGGPGGAHDTDDAGAADVTDETGPGGSA